MGKGLHYGSRNPPIGTVKMTLTLELCFFATNRLSFTNKRPVYGDVYGEVCVPVFWGSYCIVGHDSRGLSIDIGCGLSPKPRVGFFEGHAF